VLAPAPPTLTRAGCDARAAPACDPRPRRQGRQREGPSRALPLSTSYLGPRAAPPQHLEQSGGEDISPRPKPAARTAPDTDAQQSQFISSMVVGSSRHRGQQRGVSASRAGRMLDTSRCTTTNGGPATRSLSIATIDQSATNDSGDCWSKRSETDHGPPRNIIREKQPRRATHTAPREITHTGRTAHGLLKMAPPHRLTPPHAAARDPALPDSRRANPPVPLPPSRREFTSDQHPIDNVRPPAHPPREGPARVVGFFSKTEGALRTYSSQRTKTEELGRRQGSVTSSARGEDRCCDGRRVRIESQTPQAPQAPSPATSQHA